MIINSEIEKKVLSQKVKEHQAFGMEVQMLDTEKTLKIEPFLSKEILGSTYCKLDGSINSIALTLAFSETAIKNGVNFYPSTEIENFIYENNHIIGTTSTKQEKFFADKIVLATGIYSNKLLSKINIQLPIKPRRGQVIVSEPIAPLLNHALLSGRYLAVKLYPEILQDLSGPLNKMGISFGIEQTKSGNLLIGTSREFVGENKEITFQGIEYILKPVLKERRNQVAGTMGGGEQQMLAIGRALMARPKLLLLDEPSLGLAPILVEKIFSVLKKLNKEEDTTIFFPTLTLTS